MIEIDNETYAAVQTLGKDVVAELQFRDVLRKHGIVARRGQQYSGTAGGESPDVIHDLDGIHFEVKWVERLNIWDAMAQARLDCGSKTPVVAHKRNGTGWLVTMPAEDFLGLIRPKGDYDDL